MKFVNIPRHSCRQGLLVYSMPLFIVGAGAAPVPAAR
jgi:hypothetical protein